MGGDIATGLRPCSVPSVTSPAAIPLAVATATAMVASPRIRPSPTRGMVGARPAGQARAQWGADFHMPSPGRDIPPEARRRNLCPSQERLGTRTPSPRLGTRTPSFLQDGRTRFPRDTESTARDLLTARGMAEQATETGGATQRHVLTARSAP
jgi:hypothetical protein